MLRAFTRSQHCFLSQILSSLLPPQLESVELAEMTNKAGISMLNDGPPHKRRRTLHNRKSPKYQPNFQSTATSVSLTDPSLASTSSTNVVDEKKSVRKKETDQRIKREEMSHHLTKAPTIKTTADRCCTDYLSDEWRPDFRSTYPLAKALERRRVLVDYIHFVKRVNARKDRVETVHKRPSVLQPQTIEDLEKEIEKCSQELDNLSRKRDENLNVKKDLMTRYKSLYK